MRRWTGWPSKKQSLRSPDSLRISGYIRGTGEVFKELEFSTKGGEGVQATKKQSNVVRAHVKGLSGQRKGDRGARGASWGRLGTGDSWGPRPRTRRGPYGPQEASSGVGGPGQRARLPVVSRRWRQAGGAAPGRAPRGSARGAGTDAGSAQGAHAAPRPGGWGRGGRGPLTITNRSPFQPPPPSRRFPAPRMRSLRQRVRAGPRRLRRRRVARLLLAQTRRPRSRASPPRAPAPAAAPPLPVPLSLKPTASGSPAHPARPRRASPLAPRRSPRHLPSGRAGCGRPGVHPARLPALFSLRPSCSLVVRATRAPNFAPAAGLSAALTSPPSGGGI